MADPNPLAGMPLASSLAQNMNDSLQWMSRLWGSAPGGAGPAPGVPSMLMPTFDPDELEKRIADLRTVAHWLDMNRTLLQSTIQTLEMQRNAILAMQSVARPPAPDAAPGAAGPGGLTPPFDPTIWWNALQEQFARVASTAMKDEPGSEPAPPAPSPKAAAAANRKAGGGP